MEERRLVGRPKKYNTAEEMQTKIEYYFASCFKPVLDKKGNIVRNKFTGEIVYQQYRPFTMSGLADALDMSKIGRAHV